MACSRDWPKIASPPFAMTDDVLDEAYKARQAGDDARAAELCRQLLASDPASVGAKSLMAVCLAEAGQVSAAVSLAEEAVQADPDHWRFLLNLSVVQQLAGKLHDAIASVRRATVTAPQRFEPWGRLGDLLGSQGDFFGAVAALQRALDVNPAHAAIAFRLAGAAYEVGQYDTCGSALDRFEQVVPEHPEALRLRTHLAQKRNDPKAMLDAARRWLRAEPGSEAARVAQAYAHAQLDEYPSAIETYRPLVSANPGSAVHAATFAQYLLWARDFDQAEEYYTRALALDPALAEAAAGMARVQIYRGNLEQASALARQAIEADRGAVEGYSQLVLATGADLSGDELDGLGAICENDAVDPSHRAIAWFARGDVFHRRKQHDQAFDSWAQANELKRGAGASHYDRAGMEAYVDSLIRLFGTDLQASGENADQGAVPIFIVGMPRSGTTLLDAALSAHPQVASGGELPAMPNLLDRFLEWAGQSGWSGGAIPDEIASALRQAYLRQYATYNVETAAYVTDKLPINFQSVGLIRQLFPAASIIHTMRDPIETGFSIWRKNFTRSWGFATSLRDIGHYYGQYIRLMAHWDEVFGEKIATVTHSQMVTDFEFQVRRLVDHVGLEWDPRCLDYHKQERVVTTLSATQVRKAPSAGHLNSTQPYSHRLQPLRDALDEAGVRYAD